MAAVEGKGESPDFSQPWKFSDVVLVVEDKKLHVHRGCACVVLSRFREDVYIRISRKRQERDFSSR